MANFTPLSGAIGGALIGLAAALLWLGVGRIAGVSGHLHGLIAAPERRGRALLWLGGLIAGALLVGIFAPAIVPVREGFSPVRLAFAGLLVGFGTRLGSGCTSGHGVCGIGRGSPRSLAATVVFFVFGVITAVICRRMLG
ncbi:MULTISPECIES: YeeE/YedE family protein [unclassified Salinisphaera]|uniref:YeeE/YedE family protein n=1 Tax=unclassified Salinisphaera TaxID=2649847 RepID=UPI0033422184